MMQAGSYRRVQVVLDLSEREAADLANSITEAKGWVYHGSDGGWRSDPGQLLQLEGQLRLQLGVQEGLCP